jgi:hypothetical protein
MIHIYEVRPRKDRRGVDRFPISCLSVGCGMATRMLPAMLSANAEHYSRSHDAVICVYDSAGNVIETHEHKGDFKEW